MPAQLDAIATAITQFHGLSIADLLKQLRELPPHRWDPVSHNDKHIGHVTRHKAGSTVAPPEPWTEFTFVDDEDGQTHVLRAEADLATGRVSITLDGDEKEHPRIAAKPIIQGFKVKVSLRFIFDENGRQEYRFDGVTN